MNLRRAGASLVVQPASTGEAITIASAAGQGLRFLYDVVRTATPAPNAGSVTIYNLAERTRQLLAGAVDRTAFDFRPPSADSPFRTDAVLVDLPELVARRYQYAYVRLAAGYDGQLAQISEGTSARTRSRHSGVDWETTIELGDGEGQLAHATASRTFERGEPVFSAVRHLVRTMGLLAGNVTEATWSALQLLGGQLGGDQHFATPYTPEGDPAEQLTLLLQVYGLRWFVDQGAVWLLGRAGYLPEAPVDLGPPREEPEVTDAGIRATVRHSPLVRPGGRAILRSRLTRDTWFVQAVRFYGDTHGELLCDVELDPVQQLLG